jgi:phosphoribosyl-dephospho-CoA transferase
VKEGTVSVTPLHRHQLARLTAEGWARINERQWDAVAAQCLAHWAAHRLPLVVTRQPPRSDGPDAIAMGLPAPGRWERRRLALHVARADVLVFDEFPRADRVVKLLPAAARADWRSLCAGIAACGAVARVHGSFGWQHITGLDHVHPGSDIDVWVAVSDAEQADAVVAQLESVARARPRLDGEVVFDGGEAIAWREWASWRARRVRSVLVKQLDGSSLSADPGLGEAAP